MQLLSGMNEKLGWGVKTLLGLCCLPSGKGTRFPPLQAQSLSQPKWEGQALLILASSEPGSQTLEVAVLRPAGSQFESQVPHPCWAGAGFSTPLSWVPYWQQLRTGPRACLSLPGPCRGERGKWAGYDRG